MTSASEGVAMVSVADNALAEIGSLLDRMAELASSAINNSLTSSQRTTLQNQFTQLGSQIQTIARETSYDGVNLLSGGANVVVQVGYGADANSTVTVSGVQATLQAIGLGKATSDQLIYSVNASASEPAAKDAARSALNAVYAAIDQVDNQRTAIQASESRLAGSIGSLANTRENLAAAESSIRGAGEPGGGEESLRSSILKDTAAAFLAQANLDPPNVAKLLGEPSSGNDSSKLDTQATSAIAPSAGEGLKESAAKLEVIKKNLLGE
jgi:flagellin